MPIDQSALTVTQTDIGLAAIANAKSNGLKFEITHLAFGDANGVGYTPARSATQLRNERVRVPISPSGSRKLTKNSLLVQGIVSDAPSFWCREIGVIGADNTLLAVWSDPIAPRWEKRDGVSVITAYTFAWDAFDVEHVTLIAGGPDVNILVDQELLNISMAQLGNTLRWMREYDRDLIAQ